MENQKPGIPRNNKNENDESEILFSPGTWGRKGRRRGGNGPRFIGSGKGLIRLGNVANYGLTAADFGVSLFISKSKKEEDQ